MAGPEFSATPLPIGGSILFQFYGADSGNFLPPSGIVAMSLSRTGTDGSSVTVYAGPPLPLWVDVGDGPSTSSQPLNPAVSYTWQVTDSTGTATIGPLVLGGAIVTVPDSFTQLMIRLLQAACDNAVRPAGMVVQPAQVTTKGPQGGWGATPFVVLNLALFQQRDTAVGQDVLMPNAGNLWTLPGWAKRVWQISVLSQDADERDFYRDTLLIAFRALKGTLFSQVGQNIRHEWQATSGPSADPYHGEAPVFYYAEIMLTLEGVFPVTIATGFGVIEQIDMNAVIEETPGLPMPPVPLPQPGGVLVSFTEPPP